MRHKFGWPSEPMRKSHSRRLWLICWVVNERVLVSLFSRARVLLNSPRLPFEFMSKSFAVSEHTNTFIVI